MLPSAVQVAVVPAELMEMVPSGPDTCAESAVPMDVLTDIW